MTKEKLENKIEGTVINTDKIENTKATDFKSINKFVKANLHYLSKSKQKLFYSLANLENILYQAKYPKKVNSYTYQNYSCS